MLGILNYFPSNVKENLMESINEYSINYLEEIRIRVNKNIVLKFNKENVILKYIVTSEDIIKIMQKITENSIYSYQRQICEGFITLRGGHRVGISGNVVMDEGKIININYIYSLNFRIAKQIIGVANSVIENIYEQDKVYNTLIISPPGAGKTTLLKDIIRILSKVKTIGVVDERGEIAAMYKNIPQNDLGINIDILNNVPKSIGIKMLIRSMSPEVICADEIGTKEDVQAIKYALTSGVKGIFTAHSNTLEDLQNNPILKQLIEEKLVEKIIILNKNNRHNIECINIIQKNIDFLAKIV